MKWSWARGSVTFPSSSYSKISFVAGFVKINFDLV